MGSECSLRTIFVAYAKTESFQTAFHETDEGIERFIARSVPPVNNLGERGDIVPVQPDATVNPSIFAVLVVAHGAMIQLHTLNASADAVSYDKCLSAARLCVDMLIQVSPSRTLPVDMMLGVRFVYMSMWYGNDLLT